MNYQSLFAKTLLIEDDDSHALLIKRALKSLTTDIQHCRSIKEALDTQAKGIFDLIVTDLHLPDSEGVAHVEVLKKQALGIPIVVLTSSTDLNDAVAAIKMGAAEFIVKNFDASFQEVLKLCISRVFTSKQLESGRLKAEREMEVLRLSIENSSDAMAVSDQNGNIVYANKAFALFVKKCGGKTSNIFEIFSTDVQKHETLQGGLRRNFDNLGPGAVWHTEVSFVADKESAFDLSLSAIKGEDGTPDTKKYGLWVKDISEQKRREKFQREILSTTTHDLKGPLGAISLSCELLSDLVKDQEKAAKIVLRIDSSARGAVNLIDEFLSARRIQEGTFILRPILLDVVKTIADALEDYKTIAAARDINLQFVPKNTEIHAAVDKLGLSRVVGNIVSNALKFTPKGGVVSVSCWQDGDYYSIEISDTGCGMEPDEVQKIFGRFSRLDKHNNVEGTGLGLFVVKSIVSAHGGKIAVTSTPGRGTNFEILMPAKPAVDSRGELISLDFA